MITAVEARTLAKERLQVLDEVLVEILGEVKQAASSGEFQVDVFVDKRGLYKIVNKLVRFGYHIRVFTRGEKEKDRLEISWEEYDT